MLINPSHTELVAITFSLVNVSVSEDIKFSPISAPQMPHPITETPPRNAPSQKELGLHLGTLSCLCCSYTLLYPRAEYNWRKNIGTDLIFSFINLMSFWAKWWKELWSGKQMEQQREGRKEDLTVMATWTSQHSSAQLGMCLSGKHRVLLHSHSYGNQQQEQRF